MEIRNKFKILRRTPDGEITEILNNNDLLIKWFSFCYKSTKWCLTATLCKMLWISTKEQIL